MNADCAAVLLTHRRPTLATSVVSNLIDVEGVDPSRVLLVVNGEGGLLDEALERRVVVLRLPENIGPAGGFRAGLADAHRRFAAAWYYLCEDDVGLFGLPSPRLDDVVGRAEEARDQGEPVGGVVAYGRDLDGRTGLTTPHVPVRDSGLEPVDVAAWGATLVSGEVVERGLLPDEEWFFGYEDFDYFLRLRRAGFGVFLDVAAARAVQDRAFGPGRDAAVAGQRVLDTRESWRMYYEARNFLELARRHGTLRWTATHVARSARRVQLAGTWGAGGAVLRGLMDGVRRRTGPSARYQRHEGELSPGG